MTAMPGGIFPRIVALAVTTALSAALLFVLLPALRAAAEAAATGEEIAGGRQLLLIVAPALAIALLALNVGLAVFKPGWRLRGGAARSVAPSRADEPA